MLRCCIAKQYESRTTQHRVNAEIHKVRFIGSFSYLLNSWTVFEPSHQSQSAPNSLFPHGFIG
jgi:ribosome-associated toxin RatA of RatAB toxin-antitoxin module